MRLKNYNRIRILYVHDYNGHADEEGIQKLREAFKIGDYWHLGDIIIDAPAIPYSSPSETVAFLESIKKNYDYIIAYSLGAYFVMQVSGVKRILINTVMPEDLERRNDSAFSKEYLDELKSQKKDLDLKKGTVLIYGDEFKNHLERRIFLTDGNGEYFEHHQYARIPDSFSKENLKKIVWYIKTGKRVCCIRIIRNGKSETIEWVNEEKKTGEDVHPLMEALKNEYPEEYERLFGQLFIEI